jgi:DNA polymerase V
MVETNITAIFGAGPGVSAQAHVPLYSSAPAAGFPAPGDDMVEKSLNVHDLLVKHPVATFFVRVEGDSMEGAGIFSGDILVVDRSVEAVSGKIVVAAVGGGLVIKRLSKQGDSMVLMSENDTYAPIQVTGDEECFVWGVVTGSVRRF